MWLGFTCSNTSNHRKGVWAPASPHVIQEESHRPQKLWEGCHILASLTSNSFYMTVNTDVYLDIFKELVISVVLLGAGKGKIVPVLN
jgi:hypothetical protein